MTNNNGRVTLRDVYEAVSDLEAKVDKRYEARFQHLELAVEENTTFRNQLIGKITAIFTILGIGINFVWDYFVNNK